MPAAAVRPISAEQHLAFLQTQRSASFLQTPAWGRVKTEWRAESIGWHEGENLTGVALVLYRQLPVLKRSLAYLPEGPQLDWSSERLGEQLKALAQYLRDRGAFAVRIGPPVASRHWHAETVKKAIASESHRRLGDVPPDQREPLGERVTSALRTYGWRAVASDGGFGAGQPRYVFWLPVAGRTEDDVLAGMNQQWRRNIKKAAKAGVKVVQGGIEDLPAFHGLYTETAQRDSFTPRPLAYFERMFTALLAEHPDRIKLYLASHEQDLVAATVRVRVGAHTWYSYGASSTAKREVRASNAIQWQMMRDAMAEGAEIYDLRGITDTLTRSDPHIGLIQFKVGTGGQAVEYVGEWDLPISRPLYRVFDAYVRRR